MLAHNGLQTRWQSKIPLISSYVARHFSAFLHLTSTESLVCIVQWPYMTLTNVLVWHGVSYAHGMAITAISHCVPCAYNTPSQATAFENVKHGKFVIFSGDFLEIRCREDAKCLGHSRIWAVSCLCRRVCGLLWASIHKILYLMHRICSYLQRLRNLNVILFMFPTSRCVNFTGWFLSQAPTMRVFYGKPLPANHFLELQFFGNSTVTCSNTLWHLCTPRFFSPLDRAEVVATKIMRKRALKASNFWTTQRNRLWIVSFQYTLWDLSFKF